jgi:hypothetical protein
VSLVQPDFTIPDRAELAGYRLEPLGPEHNEPDYAAWTSSVDHIRGLADFAGEGWPDPAMTLADNLGDLQRHRTHFTERRGFTYTVLDGGGDVVGCLYVYPDKTTGTDAAVQSWLRADHAASEAAFRAAVDGWIEAAWPFRTWAYAGEIRTGGGAADGPGDVR